MQGIYVNQYVWGVMVLIILALMRAWFAARSINPQVLYLYEDHTAQTVPAQRTDVGVMYHVKGQDYESSTITTGIETKQGRWWPRTYVTWVVREGQELYTTYDMSFDKSKDPELAEREIMRSHWKYRSLMDAGIKSMKDTSLMIILLCLAAGAWLDRIVIAIFQGLGGG